jgi:hypothetical protein
MLTRGMVKPREAKFLTHVNKIPNSCWLWTGSTDSKYGLFLIQGRRRKTHRISYALYKGDVPDNLFVCHSCDVMRCVNPEHLFLGTCADNMHDMQCKHRSTLGERAASAKFSNQEANAIREAVWLGLRIRAAARLFNTSHTTIREIMSFKRYR